MYEYVLEQMPGRGDSRSHQRKTIPNKKMQEGKVVVWGGLQIAENRRQAKATEKVKDTPNWMQSFREYITER